MFKHTLGCRPLLIAFFFILSLPGLAQQVSPAGASPSGTQGSPAELLGQLPVMDVINDPIEPFNRSMWSFNKGMFNWVLYPLNKGYRFLIPSPVRESIGKFGWNLKYPMHLINNLLQGKFKGAGAETNRFLINTTVGLLGLFDPATSKFGIAPQRRDFEQTLAFYGGSSGSYIMIPMIGPSSARNAVGRLVDFPFDIASWLLGARAFLSNNQLSFQSDRLSDAINNDADSYALIRNLWALDRERQVRDFKIEPIKGDPEPSVDTIFLAPRDPKFRGRRKTRKVLIPETGKKMPYTCWIQKTPGPVVVIVPGLGGHRLGQSTVALAEMAYRNGYSVVTISSTMNWEFMTTAATTPLPGHPAFDSRDVIHALRAIRNDLRDRYPNHATRVAIMGYSLGAIQTLYIAAMEAQMPAEAKVIDRYLAINPPADTFYALHQLDNYFNAPMRWPAETRESNIENTLLTAVALGKGEIAPTGQIPLTRIGSEFLIGLSFRLTLRDVIYISQSEHDMGILKVPATENSRQPRYEEIRQFNYGDYMEKFVIPYYLSVGAGSYTREQLIAGASVTQLTPWLQKNAKVRVHTNANDFLVRPKDLDWFKSTFGERFVLFTGGGHLGNLYQPEVQDRIMKSLSDMR